MDIMWLNPEGKTRFPNQDYVYKWGDETNGYRMGNADGDCDVYDPRFEYKPKFNVYYKATKRIR